MEAYKKHYEDKVVLVTGGAGSIGANLTRALAELKARMVIVLDDLSAGYVWNIPSLPNVLFVKGCVTDEMTLKRVFNEEPDIVYHLAAFFANQNSVDYPERDLFVNGMGTLRVFQYAHMTRVERVVYASSGCSIYGATAPLPLKEDFMSMHLTTPYQITKMLGELYANFFHHHHKLQVVKTRFSTLMVRARSRDNIVMSFRILFSRHFGANHCPSLESRMRRAILPTWMTSSTPCYARATSTMSLARR